MLWLTLLACTTSPSTKAPSNAGHEGHEGGHGDHATVQHRFDDVEKWAKVFDDPARDAWQKPTEIVAAMKIEPGQVVADLGAGTGYLVPHLAEATGETGRVIALEVEDSLVHHMQQRFVDQPQVVTRKSGTGVPALEEAEVDHVVLLDVYHHIDQRVAYFHHFRKVMKPGGRLTIVDFDPAAPGAHGPPPEHRISREQMSKELREAGWVAMPSVEDTLEEQYIATYMVGRAHASVDWLFDQVEKGEDLQFVDVRTPQEFKQGHVPGAVNLSLFDFSPEKISEFDRSRPVVVICQSGNRSRVAAARFERNGYAAINIKGGTLAWFKSGRPVVK